MANVSAVEAMAQIEKSLEVFKEKRHVVIQKMRVGQIVRQGDIYVKKVSKKPGDGVTLTETTERQLAIGNTQGSRHIVESGNVKVFNIKNASVLTGPRVESTTPWTLAHPEHNNFTFPPGCYSVTFQKDYAKERAEEIRRVQD